MVRHQYDKYNSKNDTVVCMCMEVMICQSQMSPEMFKISQPHRIWETSKHIT